MIEGLKWHQLKDRANIIKGRASQQVHLATEKPDPIPEIESAITSSSCEPHLEPKTATVLPDFTNRWNVSYTREEAPTSDLGVKMKKGF